MLKSPKSEVDQRLVTSAATVISQGPANSRDFLANLKAHLKNEFQQQEF